MNQLLRFHQVGEKYVLLLSRYRLHELVNWYHFLLLVPPTADIWFLDTGWPWCTVIVTMKDIFFLQATWFILLIRVTLLNTNLISCGVEIYLWNYFFIYINCLRISPVGKALAIHCRDIHRDKYSMLFTQRYSHGDCSNWSNSILYIYIT